MNVSLQELLLYIPIHHLQFLTPISKESIFYESVIENIPDQRLPNRSLLIIKNDETCLLLNEIEVANKIINDPNLVAVIICSQNGRLLSDINLAFFEKCHFPIICVDEPFYLPVLVQKKMLLCSFSHVSREVAGFMDKGFTGITRELAKAFKTPILYFDENNQLLWQTGDEQALREAHRWLNTNRRKLENGQYFNTLSSNEEVIESEPFELYALNVADVFTQSLIVSAELADWQKKMVDKLVGITALILQSEGRFQEQQEKFKEHFIYDLLYHKFESQNIMIKQGKSWGWNLEKPHHLFLINVDLSADLMSSSDWLYEIAAYLQNQTEPLEEKIIVFPFEEQIVVLLEDAKERLIRERKSLVLELASKFLEGVSSEWSEYHFTIGIGKWYQDTTNLNKSYQEAKLALQFGQKWYEQKHVFHINDLGILRILIHIHREILYDFSQEYLSQLIDSDRKHDTEYIHTLKSYFQHQGVITEVADSMYIHPNTLRKRIKKIEDITGTNLQDEEEYMNLRIALKISSFINQ